MGRLHNNLCWTVLLFLYILYSLFFNMPIRLVHHYLTATGSNMRCIHTRGYITKIVNLNKNKVDNKNVFGIIK